MLRRPNARGDARKPDPHAYFLTLSDHGGAIPFIRA